MSFGLLVYTTKLDPGRESSSQGMLNLGTKRKEEGAPRQALFKAKSVVPKQLSQ